MHAQHAAPSCTTGGTDAGHASGNERWGRIGNGRGDEEHAGGARWSRSTGDEGDEEGVRQGSRDDEEGGRRLDYGTLGCDARRPHLGLRLFTPILRHQRLRLNHASHDYRTDSVELLRLSPSICTHSEAFQPPTWRTGPRVSPTPLSSTFFYPAPLPPSQNIADDSHDFSIAPFASITLLVPLKPLVLGSTRTSLPFNLIFLFLTLDPHSFKPHDHPLILSFCSSHSFKPHDHPPYLISLFLYTHLSLSCSYATYGIPL